MLKFNKITALGKFCVPVVPGRDLTLRDALGTCVHSGTHSEGMEFCWRWHNSSVISKAQSWFEINSSNSILWLWNKLVMSLNKNNPKTQTLLVSTSSPPQFIVYETASYRVLDRVLGPDQKAKNLALALKRPIRPLDISWHNVSLIIIILRYCDTSSFQYGKP